MSGPLKLYWVSGSPPSWRVMLALGAKQLDYSSLRQDVSAGDLKTPEYRVINPRGQVPTLVHGDLKVRESIAIIAYLDAAYPDRTLFGKSPMEVATVWQAVMEIESVLRPSAGLIARSLFRGEAASKADLLADAAAEVKLELDRISDVLSDGRPWLCGATLSAADCVLYPTLAWMDRALGSANVAALGLVEPGRRPAHLAAWQRRMEALPWFASTYPPHWK